ncbi:hypothetical protein [Helicobacter marmotae]|uniref:Uncharacterized protein n=1 Tax=Helicobacter marmotae TaxID=152490 RepID=A0A3D8I241_9HELI|nr:hypothetical protein [Helicobacter marmotae]RDU59199.1 hypothetical protein CQA63_07520 [Helicobacter marmotae]
MLRILLLTLGVLCYAQNLSESFMRQAFSQTSKATLGGNLQCFTQAQYRYAKLPADLLKIKSEVNAEAKALTLIVDSIRKSRSMSLKNLQDTPNLKEIASLVNVSALAKLYLLQLSSEAKDDCPSCKRIAQEEIGFMQEGLEHKAGQFIWHTPIENQSLEPLLSLEVHAILGEKLLCQALKSRDSLSLVGAYAHFAMAGLNTRALNALLLSAHSGSADAATLIVFLLDKGFYLQQNKIAATLLENTIAQGNYLQALQSNPMILKNFVVNEGSSIADIFEDFILWEQAALSSDVPWQESNIYKAAALSKESIYLASPPKQKAIYKDLISFKGQLKNVKSYPFCQTRR